MLELKDVSKYYYQDGVIAKGITKVNLELHLGEFVVITGESGSGKSTLLNVLSGLDTYEDGEMFINGEETSHYTEEDYLEYRRKYVSNIFQNFNLVNSYTVYENIELTMLMNGKNKKDIKDTVNELIDKVGLKKYKNTLTSKLSGGQKQRVAIARALANDTPIIVADEPTGALDSNASKSIIKLLSEISKDKLVIIVTHQKSEVEKYATRLIRMHDGKILEDRYVQNINLDNLLKPKDINNITRISKLRLGIRNAFNLPIKFTLMFFIYLLITLALISTYGILQAALDEEMNYSYNNFFENDSNYRLVITKQDKSIFNIDDYNKINNLNNIDYIVKNDLLNDYILNLNNDYLYLQGNIVNKKIDNVDIGTLPSKDNEVVIVGNKDNWYISSMQNDILNKTFNTDTSINNIKIVGIKYSNDHNYEFAFYLSDELQDKISRELNYDYTFTSIKMNDYYFNESSPLYVRVIANDNLKKGEVYVKDSLNSYCNDYNCVNNNIEIEVNNLYYKENNKYVIKNVYNKDNSRELLGIDYNNIDGDYIYISKEDYNNLYNKGNYQSSVFVKDLQELDNTSKELNKLGYNTLKLRDSKQNDLETILQIFRIFRLVVIGVLIIALFFISYFIIKIIYKSRNSYYTTLRTLGANKKVCINILMKELVTIASFVYILFLIFMYLININIIKIDYFKELANYIGIYEYIIVYIILVGLSIILAYRYGRKIFKQSIIKTYGERI